MNTCHDCNSSYSQPGTCNCFAPGGKRHVAPSLARATVTPGNPGWEYPTMHPGLIVGAPRSVAVPWSYTLQVTGGGGGAPA